MALIDTYRKNVIRKREELVKLISDKAREKDFSFIEIPVSAFVKRKAL